ncbi:PepSY domain-containing protein [Porticoccaceae bacterium]|nr:PepSY domain-containing protein [Porticoccaceae bacterium]
MLSFTIRLHRYLGVIFGVLILLWCISGFVMMFVQYPSLTNQERYSYMPPLSLGSCCLAPDISKTGSPQFRSFSLKSAPTGIHLRLAAADAATVYNALSGHIIPGSTNITRLESAKAVASALGASSARSVGLTEVDQWSIIPSVAKHGPFEIFELDDAEKNRLYYSTTSGELVQQVTYIERTWGWIGSVVHWIYPTVIRSNTELWVQVVIWLSAVSLFMVIIGAVIGITSLKKKRGWRKSPYQGRFLWHHYTSLATGLLMLTWLFSGLMSMYPWGLMEGRSFATEEHNLRGSGFQLDPKVQTIIENVASLDLPLSTIEIKGVMVAGFITLIATDTHGERSLIHRIAVDHHPNKEFPTVDSLAAKIRPRAKITSVDFLTSGDSYYYNHHHKRQFPVYRIIYADGERVYLDGLSFDIAAVFDQGRKTARWLYLGLHRGDFFPDLNAGMLWYFTWGGLLLLMTSAVSIACWLAFRYWQGLFRIKNNSL